MTGHRGRRPSLVARVRSAGGLVIAIVKTKGGAGGSTLAHNLAYEYAERGCRTLVVDTDTQQTVIDAATARLRPPRLTLVSWPHPTLWEDLPRLRAGQDIVIIDGQGHHHQLTRSAVAAAARDPHGVMLIPVMPSLADVRALKREMGPILTEAEGLVAWQLRVRTVLTRFKPHETATKITRAALAEPPVVAPPTTAEIERRPIYVESLGTGLAVCELQPGGHAAQEIRTLATEVAELALSDPEPK